MKCTKCGKAGFERTKAPRSMTVGEYVFTAKLDALTCPACGDVLFPPQSLEAFELLAAVELAKTGESAGAVVRFLRKSIGLRAIELASLLGVEPETVSRWENDRGEIERRSLALLESLVREKAEGRTVTRESLQAVQNPKPPAHKRIELSA